MRGRMTTMAAGMILGAAATVMMMPQLDYRTRRRVNKVGRKMINSMSSVYENMMGNR